MNIVDAVFFDLDGTLLDTTQAIISSMKYTVRRFTGRTPEITELLPYMGLPLADTFADLLPGHVDEACRVYLEHNIAIHKELVRPYPGVPETLFALRERRVKLAIVTSKRRLTVDLGLESAGLTGVFDAVVCHGDTARSKPDPEPVLLAAKLLGLDNGARPRTALFVGDSPWDVMAAKKAGALLPSLGIKTVAVTYGATPRESLEKQEPDYILDNIAELLPLCGVPRRDSAP